MLTVDRYLTLLRDLPHPIRSIHTYCTHTMRCMFGSPEPNQLALRLCTFGPAQRYLCMAPHTGPRKALPLYGAPPETLPLYGARRRRRYPRTAPYDAQVGSLAREPKSRTILAPCAHIFFCPPMLCSTTTLATARHQPLIICPHSVRCLPSG